MSSFYQSASIAAAIISVSTAQANDGVPAPAGDANLIVLRDQLHAERQELQQQEKVLEQQRARLERLENEILGRMSATGTGQDGAPSNLSSAAPAVTQASSPASAQSASQVEKVGARPEETERLPEVSVLADQGGIITRAGRLTVEPNFEYARADRNRFVFRGIEVPQSVLVGVFDINESRQDILTATLATRFGLTNRLEIGARVPFVYRDDKAVLVPLVQNPPQSGVGTIDTSADGSGLGDIELSARYQLTNANGGWPYLITGVQVILPTGEDPFEVPRDALGNATKAATGAGFWGVAPNLTMLFPSDPATLFASVGYTFNFGKDINQRISDALIERVKPGGAPNATAGIGIALNPELSVSFAYAHTWQFATKSRIRPISTSDGVETIGDPITSETRDLQVGRFLFGIGYRTSPRTTISWTVEMGATDDASDLRTTLRIPFTIN